MEAAKEGECSLKSDRLFQLLYLLLEKGTATAPEIARTLDVSVRTVYRDVEALSFAGVPLYASAGKGGGISLAAGYSLNKALLSDAEQNQILFAIQSLRATDRAVDGLLAKLGGIFKKQSVNWIEVDFSRWGLGETDHRRFDIIRNAILEKRVLEVLYCGASGQTTRRKIKPFKLIFKDKNWYLQAFCLHAEDYRLFKMGRIMELSLCSETFEDTFEDAPPIEMPSPPAPQPVTATLRFTPAVAFRVFDEFDRRSVEPQADGTLLVNAPFPLDSWAIGYLLTFGTEIEVLQPPALRAKIADLSKKIYEHHKT
ncbi:MAG TPA: YafY family protein [Candidatus Limiplasma sp.]|nr:YafY family protein [Candidatus Limiplasma sp.]